MRQRNATPYTVDLPTLEPPLQVQPGEEIEHETLLPGFKQVSSEDQLDEPQPDTPAPPGEPPAAVSDAPEPPSAAPTPAPEPVPAPEPQPQPAPTPAPAAAPLFDPQPAMPAPGGTTTAPQGA